MPLWPRDGDGTARDEHGENSASAVGEARAPRDFLDSNIALHLDHASSAVGPMLWVRGGAPSVLLR